MGVMNSRIHDRIVLGRLFDPGRFRRCDIRDQFTVLKKCESIVAFRTEPFRRVCAGSFVFDLLPYAELIGLVVNDTCIDDLAHLPFFIVGHDAQIAAFVCFRQRIRIVRAAVKIHDIAFGFRYAENILIVVIFKRRIP